MTDDEMYNTQNKAHRKRLLGYAGNETQRKCHMQNTLKTQKGLIIKTEIKTVTLQNLSLSKQCC